MPLNIGSLTTGQQRVLIDMRDGRVAAHKYYNTVTIAIEPSDIKFVDNATGTPDQIQIDNLPPGEYEITFYGGPLSNIGNELATNPFTKVTGSATPLLINIGDNAAAYSNLWVRVRARVSATDMADIITTRLYYSRAQSGGTLNAFIDRSKVVYANNTSGYADALILADGMCPAGSTVTLYNYNGSSLDAIDPATGALGGSGLVKTAGPDTYYIGTSDGATVNQYIVIQVTAADGSVAWYGTKGINGGTTNLDDFVPIEILRGGAGSENFLNSMQWYYCGTNGANDQLAFGVTGMRAGSRGTITGNNSATDTGVKDAINQLRLGLGNDNTNYTEYASASLVIDNTDGSDPITRTIDFTSFLSENPVTGTLFSLAPSVGNNQFIVDNFSGIIHVVIEDTSTGTSFHRFLNSAVAMPVFFSELIEKETLGSGFNVTSENSSRIYRMSAYNRALILRASMLGAFDNTAPTSGSISIGSGSGYINSFTNATLNLAAADDAGGSGIKEMIVSNSPITGAESRIAYVPTLTGYTLGSVSEGSSTTVYVRFYDYSGNYIDSSCSAVYDATGALETSPITTLSTISLKDSSTSFGAIMLGVRDNLSGMQNGAVTLMIRPLGASDWLTAQRIPMNFSGGLLTSGNTSMWDVVIGPTANVGIQPVTLTEGVYEYCAEMRDGAGNVTLSTINTVTVVVQTNSSFEEKTAPYPFNPKKETASVQGIIGLGGASSIEMVVYSKDTGQVVDEIEITDPLLLTSGNHTYLWSGRDRKGNPLPSGEYEIHIKVNGNTSDASGTAVVKAFIEGGNGCIW